MAASIDFTISFDGPDEQGRTVLTSEEKPNGLRWSETLVAYLHDRDLLRQEWVQKGIEQLRRGELVKR